MAAKCTFAAKDGRSSRPGGLRRFADPERDPQTGDWVDQANGVNTLALARSASVAYRAVLGTVDEFAPALRAAAVNMVRVEVPPPKTVIGVVSSTAPAGETRAARTVEA